jgi:exopolysaccharide biosynthesis polyprenyl glycosylphosphotransferase
MVTTPPKDVFEDMPRWRIVACVLLTRLVAPLVGGVTAAVLALPDATTLEMAVLAFISLLAGNLAVGRTPSWGGLLPLMGVLFGAAGPALGFVLLLLIDVAGGLPGLSRGDITVIGLTATPAAMVAAIAGRRLRSGRGRIRVALIGSSESADSLSRELRLSGEERYDIIGRIGFPGDRPRPTDGEITCLGPLQRLGGIVERDTIDLLLMSGEAPRMQVFDEIARSCLHLPVRLRELSSFYEEVFGHVAVAEINAAWFQWILHPKYRDHHSLAERVLDVLVATFAGIVTAPLLALFAILIRRDGGPVLFSQTRVGEGGRPFTIYKLRTMRVGAGDEWAAADDSRVTAIGRFLRRTHLDELPQIINVLRGEMSIVGPRPEQPDFVERLEEVVPFYRRRHLMKPGITGWAQVRCGYAGSEVGSAWKVCHDLYYLKHRSLGLNLIILGETIRTLVADPQYSAEPVSVRFILAPTETPLEAAAASAAQ